jgi:glycerol-3-phosphate dehydrogenase
VSDEARDLLAARYGYAAHEVLGVALESGTLAQPIVADAPDLLAEAVYAARREQAQTVGDVLLRRTRLGLLAARSLLESDRQAPDRVAAAMGRELGWDAARTAQAAEDFRHEAAAEGLVVPS